MKENTPLRASITGIDGSGKSTTSEIVTSQFPCDTTIVKISRPVYTVAGGEKTARYELLMRSVDGLHSYADKSKSRRLSLAANALDVVAQGRLIEPRMVKKYNPDLVLGTRDYMVDPSVYSIFYSRVLAGRSVDQRLAFFQKLTGIRVREIIFFLTVPPAEAVSRINRRIEEEKEGNRESSREKWKHMHETEEHLGKLQQEYYLVLRAISHRSEVIEIDTSRHSKRDVADQIASGLKEKLARRTFLTS